MFDLSVIICSHNPRQDYLHRTLKSLQEQTLPLENWELLLVDNVSLRPLEGSWDLSWHPYAKHISEPELGVSVARQRGMREAASDLIVFVDDDNVLDKAYLTRALGIKKNWPALGVWGSGSIIPEYELEPEASLKELIPSLAVRKTDKAYWSNIIPSWDAAPWGAGMCLRVAVADAYRRIYNDSPIQISSRRGNALLSGEDVEMAYVACKIGLGMGIFPELMLTHLIPKERVAAEYLLRLYEGTATSDALLAHKWEGLTPKPVLRPRMIMAMLKNLVMRRGVDRRMYFAKLRGHAKARRIILSNRDTSFPGGRAGGGLASSELASPGKPRDG
jgi:glycosyltransferase involved in cell wall biosynthesis